jgi:hypothetical protein
MFDLPTETDVVRCVVDEKAVSGEAPLDFVREEGKRVASGE